MSMQTGQTPPHPATRRRRGRRLRRLLGVLLMVVGLGLSTWVVVIWRWGDPFTSLYTRSQQHRLAKTYERHLGEYRPPVVKHTKRRHADRRARLIAELNAVRLAAQSYRVHSHTGQPVGRIRIPRLGLNMIVVDGTDHESLKRGPGLDPHTYMPGEGQLVYIAGHRTTYLAPFAHIDSLRRGDRIWIQTPYATFEYRIVRHVIVAANAVWVLRSHGRELLALQACHPRFFATHRYIAYAKPVRVTPRGRRALNVAQLTLRAAGPPAAIHTS